MNTDPLVASIREARHRISAEFNHDPRRLVAYYRERERRLKTEGKRRFVPCPPQPTLTDEEMILRERPSQS